MRREKGKRELERKELGKGKTMKTCFKSLGMPLKCRHR